MFALGIALLPDLTAEKLPKPDRIVAPPTPAQAVLIREGIQLHDQQNYKEAIAKYKQVLAENPWEVIALYELSFTYYANNDFQDALATARLGAQCKSEMLPVFYMLISNVLDETGKVNEAIKLYKTAIKRNPGIALLHYNLAISLRRASKLAKAKEAVKKALKYKPDHASSHLTLGSIYQEMGYRIPTVLAYSRFLVLEAESPRAIETLQALQDLLTAGVSKGDEPNEIKVLISETPKSHRDEGDFTSVETMLSIMVAADAIEIPEEEMEGTPPSPYERLVSLYSIIGESIKNSKPRRGFAATYYAPYFSELTNAGHTEAFVCETWKAGNVEGASEWASENEAKLEEFRSWSQSYQWPVK